MGIINDQLLKGLLSVLSLASQGEHLLGVDQTDKMLLIGVLIVLSLTFPPDLLLSIVKQVTQRKPSVDKLFLEGSALSKDALKAIETIYHENHAPSTPSPLTPREKEVLGLMASGFTNKEIASQIGLREGTVKCHVTSIFRKLGANARTEAVVLAIKNDLVDVKNGPSVRYSLGDPEASIP